MKMGWRCSATQPARPSPFAIEARPSACRYSSEAARSTRRLPSTMNTNAACALVPSVTSRTIAASTRSRSTLEATVRMIS